MHLKNILLIIIINYILLNCSNHRNKDMLKKGHLIIDGYIKKSLEKNKIFPKSLIQLIYNYHPDFFYSDISIINEKKACIIKSNGLKFVPQNRKTCREISKYSKETLLDLFNYFPINEIYGKRPINYIMHPINKIIVYPIKHEIIIYDLINKKKVSTKIDKDYKCKDLNFSKDGKRLATISKEGKINLFSFNYNLEPKISFIKSFKENHDGFLYDASLLFDDKKENIVYSLPTSLNLWDINNEKFELLIKSNEPLSSFFELSNNGKIIAFIMSDKLTLLNIKTKDIIRLNTNYIFDFIFMDDSNDFIATLQIDSIKIWDIKGNLLKTYLHDYSKSTILRFDRNKKIFYLMKYED